MKFQWQEEEQSKSDYNDFFEMRNIGALIEDHYNI